MVVSKEFAETSEGQAQGTEAKGKRRGVLGKAGMVLYLVARYGFLFLVGLMFWQGVFATCEVFYGDDVPAIKLIGKNNPIKKELGKNHTSALYHGGFDNFTDEEKWEMIQPSIQILEAVCPEAAEWARDRHKNGKFLFAKDLPGAYATHNWREESVKLSSSLMRLEDGMKAVAIAHEYRHSRQNPVKFFKAAAARFFFWVDTDKNMEQIVETDARLFEKEVFIELYYDGYYPFQQFHVR